MVAYTELALEIRSFDEEVPTLIASVKDPQTRVRLATFLEERRRIYQVELPGHVGEETFTTVAESPFENRTALDE